jgi:hypothetical protein
MPTPGIFCFTQKTTEYYSQLFFLYGSPTFLRDPRLKTKSTYKHYITGIYQDKSVI